MKLEKVLTKEIPVGIFAGLVEEAGIHGEVVPLSVRDGEVAACRSVDDGERIAVTVSTKGVAVVKGGNVLLTKTWAQLIRELRCHVVIPGYDAEAHVRDKKDSIRRCCTRLLEEIESLRVILSEILSGCE